MKLCTQLKAGINREIGRLNKTQALLVAIHFAVNNDAEFDVSDALAAILERVEQVLTGLDELEAAQATEMQQDVAHG